MIPLKKITRHPLVSIGAVLLGIITGIYAKPFALILENVGDIFMLLLNMCALPILITSIVSSVGMIVLGKSDNGVSIRRMLGYYLVAFILLELLVFIIASIIQPGKLSEEMQDTLGFVLMNHSQNAGLNQNARLSLWEILKNMVPKNVFESLAQGNSLQVLFASIAVGIAAGITEKNKNLNAKTSILDLCSTLFKIMESVLSTFLLLLPVGLFSMTASQIATMGIEAIKAMAHYVGCIYFTCLIVFIICTFIISVKKHISPAKAISGLKDSMILAFTTRSSIATIPVIMEDLTNLGVKESHVNLFIPIGVVIARFSMVILYVAGFIFASQLYEVDLNALQIIEGLFLCALASVAGVGSPMVVALSLFSMIFIPLGIQHTAITTLHMMVIAAIDPVLTMENVHINSMLTIFLSDTTEKQNIKNGEVI